MEAIIKQMPKAKQALATVRYNEILRTSENIQLIFIHIQQNTAILIRVTGFLFSI